MTMSIQITAPQAQKRCCFIGNTSSKTLRPHHFLLINIPIPMKTDRIIPLCAAGCQGLPAVLPFTFCADICISGKLFGNLAEKGTRKDPILNWWSLGYSHSKQFSIYSLLDKVLFRSLFLLLLYNVAEKVANQICKALYSPKPHGNQ